MTPELLTPWLVFGVSLLAFLAATGGAIAWSWRKWARPSIEFFRGLGHAVEHVKALQVRELEPNDGESIKDQVGEIVERLKDGDRRFADHEQRLSAIEAGGD